MIGDPIDLTIYLLNKPVERVAVHELVRICLRCEGFEGLTDSPSGKETPLYF